MKRAKMKSVQSGMQAANFQTTNVFSSHPALHTFGRRRVSRVWRVVKFVYKRLGLKHIVIIAMMAIYAFLGGAMFYEIEAHADDTARLHSLKVCATFFCLLIVAEFSVDR